MLGCSPIAMVLLGSAGFNRDWLAIFGLACWAVARSRAWQIGFLLVALLGNPEQVLVAVLIVWIITRAVALRSFAPRARQGLLITVPYFVAVNLWMWASGVDDSRALKLVTSWPSYLVSALTDGPVFVYSLLGATWLLVVIWIGVTGCRQRDMWFLLLGIVAAGVFTATTYDGSRVSATILSPVIAILIVDASRRYSDNNAESSPNIATGSADLVLGVGILAYFLVPAVSWNFGEAGLANAGLLQFMEPWLKAQFNPIGESVARLIPSLVPG